MNKENRKIAQRELMMLLAGVCLCLVLISSGGSEASTIVFVAINALDWKVTGDTKTVFTDAKGHLSWQVAKGRTFLKSDQDLHIYYKELKPNEPLSEVRFIDGGAIQVGASGTMEIYESSPPTKFSVRGYAVQANGFETVAAA